MINFDYTDFKYGYNCTAMDANLRRYSIRIYVIKSNSTLSRKTYKVN